ncbi:hypothetical protein DL767_010080 [Monosporascus sp. MG133]|nr:hypothetical protein DL767_010080 [Monosporascus sp. MG133]
MGPDEEHHIEEALAEVAAGSQQKAMANKWGVAESTLSTRKRGAKPHSKAHQHQQTLSPLQEDELVKWILDEENGGRTPFDFEIRQMAELINQANGDSHSFGKHWVKRFINRHPPLHKKLQDSLEASRASLELPDKIRDFQRRLKALVRELNIKAEIIVNMDEVGVREGETKKGRVIESVLTKRGPRKVSEATAWTTIIEAITAVGRRLTPAVIFTGLSLQGQWFPDCFPEWKYAFSENGWSNAAIALEWLRKVYLPETKPLKPDDWRLLILDQHVTHITTEFMAECRRNRVRCLHIPSHSSHIMQPLDIGVFAALKEYYHQETMDFGFFAASAPINKQRFLVAYREASAKAFSDRNIHSGFRATGIVPFDPDKPFQNPKMVGRLPRQQTPEPITPYQLPNECSTVWYTPSKGRDVQDQLLTIYSQEKAVPRSIRTLFKKTQKALDLRAAEAGLLRYDKRDLQKKLEAAKPQGRATVARDPNDIFPEIEQIMEAKAAAEASAKRYERIHAKDFVEGAMEINQKSMEDMQFQWQLE